MSLSFVAKLNSDYEAYLSIEQISKKTYVLNPDQLESLHLAGISHAGLTGMYCIIILLFPLVSPNRFFLSIQHSKHLKTDEFSIYIEREYCKKYIQTDLNEKMMIQLLEKKCSSLPKNQNPLNQYRDALV